MMQHKITPDEFADWQDHPITKWVMGAAEIRAQQQQEAWLTASWGAAIDLEKASDWLLTLHELRVRADTLRLIAEATLEDYRSMYEHPEA